MTATLDYVEDILEAAEKIDRFTAARTMTNSSWTAENVPEDIREDFDAGERSLR